MRIYHVCARLRDSFASGPAHGSTDSTTFLRGLLTVDIQYLDAVFFFVDLNTWLNMYCGAFKVPSSPFLLVVASK